MRNLCAFVIKRDEESSLMDPSPEPNLYA